MYATTGQVRSEMMRQIDAMRLLNCFALAVVENISISRAYRPPMSAPMLVPPIWSMGMWYSSKARRTPTWEIPRAPPPPRTTPIL